VSAVLAEKFPAVYDSIVKAVYKYNGWCNVNEKVMLPEPIRGTRDIWCRDYMPIQVGRRNFVQFEYHPDYLEDVPSAKTDPIDLEWDGYYPFTVNSTTGIEVKRSKIKLDGGNIVTSAGGMTAFLVDKVYKENSAIPRPTLRKMLLKELGVQTLIIIGKEPYDQIGHVDGVMWVSHFGTIFINDYTKLEPKYRDRLRSKLRIEGNRDIVELPYPVSPDWRKSLTAFGNYVNMVQVKGLILIPKYNIPEDEVALKVLQSYMRGQVIIEQVDCSELAKGGGALNCVTWGVMSEGECRRTIKGCKTDIVYH